jgi:protein-S-isoprenylcysteine O-methyltransferase Ste14
MTGSNTGRSGDPLKGPDGNLGFLLLCALIGGVTTTLTGFFLHSPLQVVMGVGVIVLSLMTLLKLVLDARQAFYAAVGVPEGDAATRWRWTSVVASATFLGLTGIVWVMGGLLGSLPIAWQEAIYRTQSVIPLALFGVLFLTPPLVEEDSLLDLAFDVAGGACIATGALLRLWAAMHMGERRPASPTLLTQLVTTGPFMYMRQPVPLSTVFVGVGIASWLKAVPAWH